MIFLQLLFVLINRLSFVKKQNDDKIYIIIHIRDIG
jgi:hypothetical protein